MPVEYVSAEISTDTYWNDTRPALGQYSVDTREVGREARRGGRPGREGGQGGKVEIFACEVLVETALTKYFFQFWVGAWLTEI